MKFYKFQLAIFLLSLISCSENNKIDYQVDIILKGGTIIDLSNNGLSANDIENKAILI